MNNHAILGGPQLKSLNIFKKAIIASQIVSQLKPHVGAGHMVAQTVPSLIKYMDSGLSVVAVTPLLEVLGFVKLYPYISKNNTLPLGYEFSSWVSKKKGVGLNLLKKSLEIFHTFAHSDADLFAVCSTNNPKPQEILFKAGGTNMKRPSYVPNMLEAQTGTPHQETIINLKTISS